MIIPPKFNVKNPLHPPFKSNNQDHSTTLYTTYKQNFLFFSSTTSSCSFFPSSSSSLSLVITRLTCHSLHYNYRTPPTTVSFLSFSLTHTQYFYHFLFTLSSPQKRVLVFLSRLFFCLFFLLLTVFEAM